MTSFQLPSAKHLTVKKTVEAFVPTSLYWEILTNDSNDVVFGTRGSGKTMLLRMMSVSHLLEFAEFDERARKLLYDKHRFGVFLPIGIDWCVAISNSDDTDGHLFAAGLNLAAASALVETLSLIVHSVFRQPDLEQVIVKKLADQWFNPPPAVVSFADMRDQLLRQQALLGERLVRQSERASTETFLAASLFAPIVQATRILNPIFGLSDDHRWLLCLDELEGLHRPQMQLVATFLRGTSASLALKITTLPYTFDASETGFAPQTSAVDFRDYEIKRLQYDPRDPEFKELALGILHKRLVKRAKKPLPKDIFDDDEFADRAALTSESFVSVRESILGRKNTDSARKSVPVAALRSLRRAVSGNQNSIAYSGWSTLLRLSDGNPGVFVRLLNALKPEDREWPIAKHEQHRTVRELGGMWLNWSQALYADGSHLLQRLSDIGDGFSRRLHDKSIKDEDVLEEANRFLVDLRYLSKADNEAFKVAARHGLLVAETQGTSQRYPEHSGIWRLSYAMAPYFWLLPRRGRIGTRSDVDAGQLHLFEPQIEENETPEPEDVI